MELVSLHRAQDKNCMSSRNNCWCESPSFGLSWSAVEPPHSLGLLARSVFQPEALRGLRAPVTFNQSVATFMSVR